MNQENNCCDKCIGWTVDDCPCHQKNHTRDWAVEFDSRIVGTGIGAANSTSLKKFISQLLISQKRELTLEIKSLLQIELTLQKKELVEKLESEIKKTQSANASLVNPIPALNDTLEELLAAIKVISEV